jgi:hypothetical protein
MEDKCLSFLRKAKVGALLLLMQQYVVPYD